MIIGLIGEKFAGKDAVADFLAEKYNFKHIRFSHIFDEILDILDIPISRENEIKLGGGIRQVFGEAIFTSAVAKRIKNSEGKNCVVNGIRLQEEYEALRKLNTKFVYITAPAKVRFSRYKSRHQKVDDGKMDFENFLAQELTHTEQLIPILGKMADLKIENTGSLEELYQQIYSLIEKLKIKM